MRAQVHSGLLEFLGMIEPGTGDQKRAMTAKGLFSVSENISSGKLR
jgi:hypothetical protein